MRLTPLKTVTLKHLKTVTLMVLKVVYLSYVSYQRVTRKNHFSFVMLTFVICY